jgi:Dolichyl-phosphate-mannose-protein mannosyltransferase
MNKEASPSDLRLKLPSTRDGRLALYLSILVLFVVLCAKIVSIPTPSALEKRDLTTGLSALQLTFISAACEISILGVYAVGYFRLAALGQIWLSGLFISYHLQRIISQTPQPKCNCLGALAVLSNQHPITSDTITLLVSVLLFLCGAKIFVNESGTPKNLVRPSRTLLEDSGAEAQSRHLIEAGIISAFTFLAILIPVLNVPTVLGGDEHFEFLKALGVNRGHALYTEIWSEQPPYFTFLLAGIMKIFGVYATPIRVLLGVLNSLGVFAIVALIGRRSLPLTGLAFILIYFSSPVVHLLMCSAMQEVPMMSLSILGHYILCLGVKRENMYQCMCGGLLFAIAVQVKYTAVIFVFASLLGILVEHGLKALPATGRIAFFAFIGFAVGTLPCLFLYTVDWWQLLVGTHFWAEGLNEGVDIRSASFPWNFISQQKEIFILALFGIWSIAWKCQIRQHAYPLALLCCEIIFAIFYRPWWDFYYVGLILPVSWLAAIGFGEGVINLWLLIRGIVRREIPKTAVICSSIAIIGFGGSAIWKTPLRCISFVMQDVYLPIAGVDPWVRRLRSLRTVADTIYSDIPIAAFHAQMELPPQLVVLSAKRFWTKQITDEKIAAILQREPPELLLLFDMKRSEVMESFIQKQYSQIETLNGLTLYASRKVPQNRFKEAYYLYKNKSI